MTRLKLGVLAYPVTAPTDFAMFAEKVDRLVQQGKAGGADMLVMPEYASMELAAAGPDSGNVTAELADICAQREALLTLFRETARRHQIWLLPGSLPWEEGGRVRNRAPLVSPDGRLRFQDKSVMTRFEAEQWGVEPGLPPCVFETPWGLVGIAICYDVEFPTLVRAQAQAGARLILAPSCTDTLHGFNRVRLSARARALENQCFVAVAPTVGVAPALATLDENHGYAAVFGPVDRSFPADGVIVRGGMDQPGWVFADLDFAQLDKVRAFGAVRNFRDYPAEPPFPSAGDVE